MRYAVPARAVKAAGAFAAHPTRVARAPQPPSSNTATTTGVVVPVVSTVVGPSAVALQRYQTECGASPSWTVPAAPHAGSVAGSAASAPTPATSSTSRKTG